MNATELRIREANMVPTNWIIRQSANFPEKILAENRISGTKFYGTRDLFARKFLRTNQ